MTIDDITALVQNVLLGYIAGTVTFIALKVRGP